MVYPGTNSEPVMSREELPTTIVTAIVSPNARATPSTTAPMIPGRA